MDLKEVNIYLNCYGSGSKFKWEYYLEYKGAVKKACGSCDKRFGIKTGALKALSEAIDSLKEPCLIIIHSEFSLEFEHISTSRNSRELSEILSKIIRAGHLFKIGDKLDKKILEEWNNSYSKTAKRQTEPKETQKESKEKQKETKLKSREEIEKEIEKDWEEMRESRDSWNPFSGGY